VPDRPPVPRLSDIVEAILRIQEMTRGRTSGDIEASWRDRLAIERCLEIISEASRHLPDAVTARHPAIEWRKIAGIGNVLRHDYERISMSIIWSVIVDHLPVLLEASSAELELARSKDNG
jgi:uncharacterized protein with HEPN domain